MNTVTVKASEVKIGNKIVFIGNNNKEVVIGEVDRIYRMVNNQLQFRFLPGSNIFSAMTNKIDEDIRIVK